MLNALTVFSYVSVKTTDGLCRKKYITDTALRKALLDSTLLAPITVESAVFSLIIRCTTIAPLSDVRPS